MKTALPDITTTISAYTALKRRGARLWGLCPLPGHAERTPSFSVNEERQRYHCFGCNKGGDVVQFIRDLQGLTYPEALKHLGIERGGLSLERKAAIRRRQQERDEVRDRQQREKELHISLCAELRAINRVLEGIRTENDLEKLAWLYHERTAIEAKLHSLEERADRQPIKQEAMR